MMVESVKMVILVPVQGFKGQVQRYGWLLGQAQAPTTQCHFRPRFSAVQPPSELIPCHAFELLVSFFATIRGRAIQPSLYIRSILYNTTKAQHPTFSYPGAAVSRTRPSTLNEAHGLHLHFYSGRAHTCYNSRTTGTPTQCAILSKYSHYAPQQSLPSSFRTSNLSSPPYRYHSPTTFRLPQIGSNLKNNTAHPRRNHKNNSNHTTTSSADKTTTPAHQATTTAPTLARPASAARPAHDAVLMQRDMSLAVHEERLAQARSERFLLVRRLAARLGRRLGLERVV